MKVFQSLPRPIENYLTDKEDGINWIKIGDVGAGEKYIDTTSEKILPSGVSRSRYVKRGDFLLSNSMSFGRPYILRTEGCIHDGWLVIEDYQDSFETDYLYYCLSSNAVLSQYARYAAGSSVLNLNKDIVSKVYVAIPEPNEQSRISAVLSALDELIGQLAGLVAKKRNMKQAAMQELLTGKRRLPGFEGEWEVKRLGEIAEVRSGGTPSTTKPDFWDGDVPWCTPTDITAIAGRKYLQQTARSISKAGLQASSAELIPPQSVIMTSRATIGECAINPHPITTNQGFKNLVPAQVIDTEFLYYIMCTQKAALTALCGGSTFLEIGKKQVSNYQVFIPTARDEQTAIATILSEMDAELAALEARRDKARELKQGMMQELLTGRIRLQ